MNPSPRTLLRYLALLLSALLSPPLVAQSDGAESQPFISVDAPLVALVGATVLDGTGGPAAEHQTIVLRDGRIEAVGAIDTVVVPEDARILDLDGKTVLPGFVMLHEHLFYPAGGDGAYNTLVSSFPKLYLAGGATTIRTGGSMMPYADLNLARSIASGDIPGPDIHVTGPYLNGPGLPIPGVKALAGVDDARRMVRYWSEEGATSFKAYMHIDRDALGTAIEEAHARGLKVTGHLCSVTYREAADLGIDNLEHGFFASTDFVAGKSPDKCPEGNSARQSLLELDPKGEPFLDLVRHLVEREVAITSTMTVFETFTPGRPPAPARVLDAMSPTARDDYQRTWSRIAVREDAGQGAEYLQQGMALEKAFADAGGLLVVGTDPTGYGGVVAGFANQRALELLVEGGFGLEEAVEIATLNGARYLERDAEIGSVEIGKRADLIVVDGNLLEDVSRIHQLDTVFKAGIGYDPAQLIEAARGTVGLR